MRQHGLAQLHRLHLHLRALRHRIGMLSPPVRRGLIQLNERLLRGSAALEIFSSLCKLVWGTYYLFNPITNARSAIGRAVQNSHPWFALLVCVVGVFHIYLLAVPVTPKRADIRKALSCLAVFLWIWVGGTVITFVSAPVGMMVLVFGTLLIYAPLRIEY